MTISKTQLVSFTYSTEVIKLFDFNLSDLFLLQTDNHLQLLEFLALLDLLKTK
jgi:hypothetical protein